ncbi:ligase-associated DNA damage response endonuclease PdeM [Algiphilus sp.]|uniref:ligase-associated DNA damage response endonuclease PdeM n=1 Tax=Algiphilus sp. TaxID=1872431 RepID=UPI0025C51C12|nr:ligase-associated DNA damage response endonuclease PdeM [Algiphilus sp.]MCK5771462.1 ligase-associated DNA damage response endonuclease PdeM [Algiphilus sp.]
MSAAALPVTVSGEPVMLDSRRALYWPGGGVLAIADVHLGKGEAFRRRGVAVPSGHTQADCDAIDALLRDYRPARLIVCGDLLHAPARGDEAWLDAFRTLRRTHADVAFEMAVGNHDRGSRLPADLGLDCHSERVAAPFVFTHEPGAHGAGHAICGHLHPVVRLRGMGDNLRMPVFWLRRDHAVLPAFGSFTGGAEVTPEAGDQVFAVSDRAVQPLPHLSARSSSCAS